MLRVSFVVELSTNLVSEACLTGDEKGEKHREGGGGERWTIGKSRKRA